MTETNLRPAHHGGKKRCQTCGLDCQSLAAGNLAARDSDGRPLPFTAEFIRAAQARSRSAPFGKPRETAVGQQFSPAPVPATARHAAGCGHWAGDDSGRCWSCMAPGRARPAVTVAAPTTTARRPGPFLPGSPEWLAERDKAAGYVPQGW